MNVAGSRLRDQTIRMKTRLLTSFFRLAVVALVLVASVKSKPLEYAGWETLATFVLFSVTTTDICVPKMSVTLHCDVGDIKIELFCEDCPKTSQNFLALAASDYYNGCIFHRNIKGFMVQTGDPTGTGKGGQSIYPGG